MLLMSILNTIMASIISLVDAFLLAKSIKECNKSHIGISGFILLSSILSIVTTWVLYLAI